MGLSSDLLWSLDHQEFHVLKQQWAFARAEHLNLHASTDGVPFTVEDIMEPESRAQRVADIKADRAAAEMRAEYEMFKIGLRKGRGGSIPDEAVPEWMRKAKVKQHGR